MNKLKISVLCAFFFCTNSYSQCTAGPKVEATSLCKTDFDPERTTIEALGFTPLNDELMKIEGGVCIGMGSQLISTPEVLYNENKGLVSIETPLIYRDKKQIIHAKSAKINLQSNKATIKELNYSLTESKANGRASQLTTDENISHLKEMTYTTCPSNDQQWYIQAQTADINQESQVGTFKKMTLNFKGVPILYFPYAKMPLSDQRESGLLIPDIRNSSNNGFDLALPYYFNISENMDATLTPRYLSKRGTMLGAEFRYLGQKMSGKLYADYLPSDRLLNRDRGYVEFNHQQSFKQNWSLNSRLKNVSDRQYFEDFGNNIFATSQAYLYSYLNVNGFGDRWSFQGRLSDFQIISDTIALNNQPYQSLPSLNYSWFNNSYTSTLNYGVDSQWTSLYRENSITVNRLDATSYIEKTFQNQYAKFTPKLRYRYTNWDYANTQFSGIENLDSSRSLPIASLDYSLFFEKQLTSGGYGSIEPRLFYLYAPYQNQQNIPLFDTSRLTFGRSLLYQSNAFSGVDRQSDANQVSLGITQRHYDAKGTEKWNLTLGQIAYFADRKVQLNNTIETRSTSPIITDFNYFYRNWRTSLSVHWDTQINKAERALLKFQYKGKNNSLFNFAYRFRQGKIEQLDSSVVLPIGLKNRFIARWNYSLDSNKTIEAIAGFEHKNCCWATRLIARRYIFNEDGDVNNGIFFELQLNGLGAIGRNPRRLLKQSILGYSEEF